MPYVPMDISTGETNNGALLLPTSGGQKFFRLRKMQ